MAFLPVILLALLLAALLVFLPVILLALLLAALLVFLPVISLEFPVVVLVFLQNRSYRFSLPIGSV